MGVTTERNQREGRLEKKRSGRNKGGESQKPTREEEKARKSGKLGGGKEKEDC